MLPIDRAQHLLNLLGWSHGDICVGSTWTVYAHRDEERILVRAFGQADAWNEALRQAGAAQRDQKQGTKKP